MKSFAAALKGGDRRSIGRADEVFASVRRNPTRFDELWSCLSSEYPLVRMRAADALEKLSRKDATGFDKHKKELLSSGLDDGTAEVRWHLIAITSRLTLSAKEAAHFIAYCDDLLREDGSRIVKVAALQAACDLALKRPSLASAFLHMLMFARSAPWPSVRARAKKICDVIEW
jgi:hypothetical protein